MPEDLVINIGPSHPSTHGVCRVLVHLDGEVIVKAEPIIGHLHRGIEKIAENRTYLQVVPLTDRLDYVGSMYANWAYCRAVERLAGIRVPMRAEYIRVIVCELQRIASHMMSIGPSGADAGATTVFLYTFAQRDHVIDLFEELCGARLTYNYVRPGGVAFDLPDGWTDRLRAFLAAFPRALAEIDKLLFGNIIARRRMKGSGVLVFLYLLFEHQSKPDRWMRFRLLKYMCRIWEESFKQNPEQTELPLILPVVFYQG